ncbi:MAG: TlpA family protein disulfide reductase [Acidobacteria bacterium]|nr:TlpA family protein disulfide reductase [Acidobacteriota bacterium]
MRNALVFATVLTAFISIACTPPAAPVEVSNRPASVNERPTMNAPMAQTKPLSEMSWTDQKDTVQKVGDLKGKAVILDFWATYCDPCRREIPHLNSLLAKYGADNLHIVGVNVGGEEDYPEIPKFIAQTKIDYPIGFPEPALANYIFAQQDDIPQTLVIDRNGAVITKVVGFDATIQHQLDAAVERAVKVN